MLLARTLAQAHLKRRRSQNIITILGIAIGVMVLTTALSLTNGFTQSLIQATLKAVPLLALQSYNSVPDPVLEKRLKTHPEVSNFAPFLLDKGLLTRPASMGRDAGVDFATVFGITHQEADVLGLDGNNRTVLEHLGKNEVVLGQALARNLGAFVGDKVRLLNSEQRRIELTIKGTFNTGNYLIDSGYAFIPLDTLRTISSRKLTGYHVGIKQPNDAPQIGLELSQGLYFASVPWQNFNATLIEQMALQKRVIGIVVFLIVIVASFGIANILMLTVFEKTSEIAILRAMGASKSQITWIFVLEGVWLGGIGLIFGNILGFLLSYYFKVHPFPLPGDLYFISALPVQMQWIDFAWVNVVSLTTTLLASFIPARRAASIEPARIIR